MAIKELLAHNELLLNLTLQSIKVRYKQSLFGILWAILKPLSTTIVFTVIFSYFVKVPSNNIPYPVFSFCAIIFWTFIASSLSSAVTSLTSNANIVTKIYFPREIYPISAVFACFIDFLISAAIFLILLFYYKIHLTLYLLYVIPLLLIQIMFTVGISLFASAINVFYRDVNYALSLILQLWMYATPVIYPANLVPEKYKFWYMLNPMSSLIEGYRNAIFQATTPDYIFTLITLIISVIVMIASYIFFKKVEMYFADVI